MQEMRNNKKERARQYAREYRREGFGKISDKRYYERHRAEIIRKVKERRKKRREAVC